MESSLPEPPLGLGHSGRSHRIVAVEDTPQRTTDEVSETKQLDHNEPQPGWKRFLAYVGPGFLISLAYLDPGNLETDLQAGSNHGYKLLWVVLIGMIFVVIIQSLAANLGVCTGKHLAELCRFEYPKYTRFCLWVAAEVVVVAADIPEAFRVTPQPGVPPEEAGAAVAAESSTGTWTTVWTDGLTSLDRYKGRCYNIEPVPGEPDQYILVGTSFALNILFHIPIWAGVLITGFSTLLLLGLQKYGVRKLEALLAVAMFLMAVCFFVELSYVKPPAAEVLKGLFVPNLGGKGAAGDVVALLGAIVSPPNLFLHSAVVLTRKTPASARGVNDTCRFFLIETGLALSIAFAINVSLISVVGSVCSANGLSDQNASRCNDLTLNSATFLFKNVLRKSSSIVYGIALLASGQGSSITYTYTGQFVMQGFLNMQMQNWLQNLVTRSLAIVPSLIVAIIGGATASGQLIIIASMVLSFQFPFTLIPLLKFSNTSNKMGPHKNSFYIIAIAWILVLGMIGINTYFLSTAFVSWLIHSNLPKVGKVLVGIIVFPLMAIYALFVIYLIFRKDKVVTFSKSEMEQTEGDIGDEGLPPELQMAPYREDLAHIPLPE